MTSIRPLPKLRATDPDRNPSRRDLLLGDFSTTTACNARCLGCYTNAGLLARSERDRYSRRFLSESDWLQLLDELIPYIRTLVLSGLGDATFQNWPMNQRIMDHSLRNDVQVLLFTNGLTMNDAMADWIAERKGITIIGKWLHTEPLENQALLGLPKHRTEDYDKRDGLYLPRHLTLLMDRGLQADNRLAVASTMLKWNHSVAPVQWRWLRERNVIPIFSWLVPTPGMGRMAKFELHQDLEPSEKERLTRECWQIDQELGIQWDYCMGPKISASGCKDDRLLYFGPIGDVRVCPSSHDTPQAFWPDQSVEEVIAIKSSQESVLGGIRNSIEGKATCICSTLCANQHSGCSMSSSPEVNVIQITKNS
ncbi:MAG: hypothetical protein KDB03_18540 [Planctomycetales bacterium]|nr:hypothetical protein [Planctomycetales bacterium]